VTGNTGRSRQLTSYHYLSCSCCFLGSNLSKKSPKLIHWKSDRDEI